MENIEVLSIGKYFRVNTSAGVTRKRIELSIIIKELLKANVHKILDFSTPSEDRFDEYHPTNLKAVLSEFGISYSCYYYELPDSEVIKNYTYYDILSPSEQSQYEVPLSFERYCLQTMPTRVYDAYFQSIGQPVAMLFNDWEIKDKSRIFFSRLVFNDLIPGIEITHLMPVLQAQNHQQQASFLPIKNAELENFATHSLTLLNQNFDILHEFLSRNQNFTSINSSDNLIEFQYQYSKLKDDQKKLQEEFSIVIENNLVLLEQELSQTFTPNEYEELFFIDEYVPSRYGFSEASISMLAFKNNDVGAVKSWSCKFSETVASRGIKFDYIIRALGSDELLASGDRPLDSACGEIAKSTGAIYIPTVLKKNRPTQTIKFFNPDRRLKEINEVYEIISQTNDLNNKNLLIVDDIYTMGTTYNELKRCVREVYPLANIYGHFMGRTKGR